MRRLLLVALILLSYAMYSQETVQLDTVVLNGVRADVKTPVSQKTITAQDIQQVYSGQELPVILNKTPNITSNSDGGHPQGYNYFRLRGIDQTRINMTLNGVPLNEPEDQGVYFSNYPNFAKNIKSLQIQRGVGTSTNGVASFAGSINFESKQGLEKSTELELEYGSWDTKRINFTYGSGLSKNGKFSSFINLSKFETDGYKYHSGGDGYSGFVGLGYYGNTDTFKFTAFSGNSNANMSWFAVAENDIKVDSRTNYNDINDDDNFSQTLAMLEYKKFLNSKNSFSTTIFYNRLDGEWDLNVGDKLNFGLHSNFYGIIGNYTWKPDNFNINVGVSGNKYDRNHTMVILPDTEFEYYNNTGYKDEFSTYLKVKYDIDKFTVFGDAQYRYSTFTYNGDVNLEKQDWKFFNPKFGITYNVDKNFNIYTSIGQSHREPTRSDMFGGEDNLIEFINVTPEEVVDYEIGANYKDDKLQLQTNVYYMDFNNEITLIGALGSYGLQQFGNVETSYRSGVEVDLGYDINKNLTVKYNGVYSDNKITDQGITFEPLYTPRLIQNLALNFHTDKFFVEVSGKQHSKSYLDFANENTTPSFVIANFNSGITMGNFGIKVQLINVFGTEYFTNGYMDGGVKNFYVNAPTSVYGTLTYKF